MKKYTITKAEILAMHTEEWTHTDKIIQLDETRYFCFSTSRLGSKYVFVWAYDYSTGGLDSKACAVYDPDNGWKIKRNRFLTITD